jgi:hypothetical protein
VFVLTEQWWWILPLPVTSLFQAFTPSDIIPSFFFIVKHFAQGYRAGAEFQRLKEFNPTSRDHIAWILTNRLNVKLNQTTTTGKPIIDEITLMETQTQSFVFEAMSEPVEEMPASEQETQVSEPAGPIGPGKSIEDMKQNMDLINEEIKLIRNETMLFDRLLSRVSEKKTEVDEQTRPESRKSRKSKLVKLNEIQKLEIAQKEYDLIREENRKIIGDYEKQIEIIRNISEEFELREMSMRKFLYEFDREVINAKKKQGQQNSNKKQAAIYSAEKYEKFSENKIKEKDKLLENLRNKNTKLAEMNRIYCHQLKQLEKKYLILCKVKKQQKRLCLT